MKGSCQGGEAVGKAGAKLAGVVLGAGATAALGVYLYYATTIEGWKQLVGSIAWGLVGGYLVLWALTMLLKAWRYQLLVGGSMWGRKVGLGRMVVVSLVANLFVDLLPARVGSVAYVVVLERMGVKVRAGVSSLAMAMVLDMLALVVVVGLALAFGGGQGGLWVVMVIIAGVGLVALVGLERVGQWVEKAGEWAGERLGGRAGRWLGGLGRQALDVAADLAQLRRSRLMWPLLGLSVGVRLAKYGSLTLLVWAVAGGWGAMGILGPGVVVPALVAAEATASLPISGIAGFGAYEGVLIAAFSAAGLGRQMAAMVPVAMHLITQVVDYTAGAVALGVAAAMGRMGPQGP